MVTKKVSRGTGVDERGSGIVDMGDEAYVSPQVQAILNGSSVVVDRNLVIDDEPEAEAADSEEE